MLRKIYYFLSVVFIFNCHFVYAVEAEETVIQDSAEQVVSSESAEVVDDTMVSESVFSDEETNKLLDEEEAIILKNFYDYFNVLDQLKRELENEYSYQSLYHDLSLQWGKQLLRQPEEVRRWLGIDENSDFDVFFQFRPAVETKKVLYVTLERLQKEVNRSNDSIQKLREKIEKELLAKFVKKKKVTIHTRNGVVTGYLMAIGTDKIQVGQKYILKNDIEIEDAARIFDDIREELIEERFKEEKGKIRANIDNEIEVRMRVELPEELCKAGYLPNQYNFVCSDDVVDFVKYIHTWHVRNEGMDKLINSTQRRYAVDCIKKADVMRHSAIQDLGSLIEKLHTQYTCKICHGTGSLYVESTTAAAVEVTDTVGVAGEKTTQNSDMRDTKDRSTTKVVGVAQRKTKGAAVNVEIRNEPCSSCVGSGYLISGFSERVVRVKQKKQSLELPMIIKLWGYQLDATDFFVTLNAGWDYLISGSRVASHRKLNQSPEQHAARL